MDRVDEPEERASEIYKKVVETSGTLTEDEAQEMVAILRGDDAEARKIACSVVRHEMGIKHEGVSVLRADFSYTHLSHIPSVELDDNQLSTLVEPLTTAVKRPDPELGSEAAEMLAILVVAFEEPEDHEQAIKTALETLQDAVAGSQEQADTPQTTVRKTAVKALEMALTNLHDPAALEENVIEGTEVIAAEAARGEEINDQGNLPEVRETAIGAMSTILDTYTPLAEAFAPLIVDLLDERNPELLHPTLNLLNTIKFDLSEIIIPTFQSLLDLSAHEDPSVAAQAMNLINHRSVESALPIFVEKFAEQLDREDPEVVEAAVSVLNRAADEDAQAVRPHAEALVGVLTDDRFDVKYDRRKKGAAGEAANALSSITDEFPEVTEDVITEVQKSLAADDRETVARAIRLVPQLIDFRSPSVDREMQEEIVEKLSQLTIDGDTQRRVKTVDALNSILTSIERRKNDDDDDEPDEPSAALLTVREAIETTLTSRTTSGLQRDAASAAATFVSVYPEASIELADAVVELLKEDDVDRHAASDALEYIATAAEESPEIFVDNVPLLDSYLTHEEEQLRREAANTMAIIAIDHGETLQPAVRHLRDCLEDEYTRKQALKALSEIAFDIPSSVAPVGPTFVGILAREEDKHTVEEETGNSALMSNPPARLEELVVDFSESMLDLYAVRGIAGLSISEPEAIEGAPKYLFERLADGARGSMRLSDEQEVVDQGVRRHAVFSLANLALHKPEEMKEYHDLFVDYTNDDEDFIRLNALRGVAWTTTPETGRHFEAQFVEMLEEDDPLYRRDGIIGLGRLDARDHLTEIKRLERTDEDEMVRSAANVVVDQLEGKTDDITTELNKDNDIGVFMPDDSGDKYSL